MDVVLHTSVWIFASLISCNTSSGAKWVSESLISKRVFKVLMDAFAWSLARWVSPSMIMASAWMKAWTTGWKIRRHFLKSWMPFATRPLSFHLFEFFCCVLISAWQPQWIYVITLLKAKLLLHDHFDTIIQCNFSEISTNHDSMTEHTSNCLDY